MRLHELKPAPGAVKRKKRVGRGPGSGHGKTSCRGMKGQKSRSGGGVPAWFEGGQTPLHRRVPKRGFTPPRRKEYVIVNLDTLDKKFDANCEVNPSILIEKGIIKRKRLPIKVLAKGEITKPLKVKAHQFSAKAKEKIEAAGGEVEIIK